jgi:hypothetical protein
MGLIVRVEVTEVNSISWLLFWYTEQQAPLTEELVFRACMIPILLCGGFNPYSTMILCPIFFSLGEFVNVKSRNCIWLVRFCNCLYMRIFWALALIVQKCSRQFIKIHYSTVMDIWTLAQRIIRAQVHWTIFCDNLSINCWLPIHSFISVCGFN